MGDFKNRHGTLLFDILQPRLFLIIAILFIDFMHAIYSTEIYFYFLNPFVYVPKYLKLQQLYIYDLLQVFYKAMTYCSLITCHDCTAKNCILLNTNFWRKKFQSLVATPMWQVQVVAGHALPTPPFEW